MPMLSGRELAGAAARPRVAAAVGRRREWPGPRPCRLPTSWRGPGSKPACRGSSRRWRPSRAARACRRGRSGGRRRRGSSAAGAGMGGGVAGAPAGAGSFRRLAELLRHGEARAYAQTFARRRRPGCARRSPWRPRPRRRRSRASCRRSPCWCACRVPARPPPAAIRSPPAACSAPGRRRRIPAPMRLVTKSLSAS